MEKNMNDTPNNQDNHEEDDLENLPPNVESSLAWAMMEFNCKFSEYIKEMNPDLWKKAVDYAVTFTKVHGITFEYVKTQTSEDVVATVDVDATEPPNQDEVHDDEWFDAEDDAH
jgi:hypothetical protein